MKTVRIILGTTAMSALMFTACSKNDDGQGDLGPIITPPTAIEFHAQREDALAARTQHFQMDADNGYVSVTTEKGVTFSINGDCLTKNGNDVNGTVDIDLIEMFDRGDMLVTNKPTMGFDAEGNKALLVSGGEFFIALTQDGDTVDTGCGYTIMVPSALTGGADMDMLLWTGVIDEDGDLAWEEDKRDGAQGEGGVFVEGEGEGALYYAFVSDFGWTNVDRFYSDPRPKTTLKVAVPDGYDNENCAVYLSYDGEGTALAHLDTYLVEEAVFSEHYGQIPVGLECHVIFMTEQDGDYRYAVKAVTIAENEVITFEYGETVTGSEADLTTLINGLP